MDCAPNTLLKESRISLPEQIRLGCVTSNEPELASIAFPGKSVRTCWVNIQPHLAEMFANCAREPEALSAFEIWHFKKNNTRLKLLLDCQRRTTYSTTIKLCFDFRQAVMNDMIRIASVSKFLRQVDRMVVAIIPTRLI